MSDEKIGKSIFETLDHPCRETCSGWTQGFERGGSARQDEVKNLIEKLRVATTTINEMQNLAKTYSMNSSEVGRIMLKIFNLGSRFNSQNPALFNDYLKSKGQIK